ncbi:GDP dissociation inhibitor-domain-containing protein [Linnemannia elongata]|nr:GDP dissociation inhibitor-domain-containing protein [Linnemannia elongata]
MADTDSLDSTVFDAILLGTGFTQTIVAAALARAGKTVLHLDENDYYGGASGAFGVRDLLKWATRIASTSSVGHDASADKIEFERLVARSYNNLEFQFHRVETGDAADTVIDLTTVLHTHKDASAEDRIKAVEEHITAAYTPINHNPSKESKEAISSLASWASTPELGATASQLASVSFSQIQLLEEFLKNTRKYNFDLSPKLLYSRGPLTNLLISSGIGKYLEFKLLERTAVYEALTDKVEMMPTSKEDVFVSKALSLKEKRLLMKFLQFAVDYENQTEVWEDYKHAPFTQFVQSAYGLTDKVLTAVVYAIGFDGNDYATTTEGLKSVKVYLQSLGRYGNSAYLCPLYGVGSELAQAFCRVSAVYGGIYMLQHALDKHTVDKETNKWQSVVDHTGQTLKANQIICSREYLSKEMDEYIEARTLNRNYVSHCIIVTDRSAFGETTLCKTLFPMGSLVLNPGETPVQKNKHTVSVLQMCGGTMSCPNDRYILYVWAESANLKTDAKQDLMAAIRKLVHIPGDPLSLKAAAPTQVAAANSTAPASADESKPAQHLGDAPAGEDQPRMSLDQELDMEQVRQEILQAEKKLFEESENTTPVPSRPSTPAPGAPSSTGSSTATPTKPLSRTAFQKSKSATSLSMDSIIAPNALFTMFYKRAASWPRVPYPIGSEDLKPLPDNLTVVRPMNHSLDFEAATEEARAIFEKLCPGEEFLPPTPEPEDNSGF